MSAAPKYRTAARRVRGLGAARTGTGHFIGQRVTSVALLFLTIAIFLPPFEVPRATYDYLVVFDITQSMNVEDYELDGAPVSRLTFARAAVRRTLHELPCGSRVGWGIFTEYRTLVLLAPIEVCENYNDLLASLDRIDGRMRWANASQISKGLFWAMRGARDLGGRPSRAGRACRGGLRFADIPAGAAPRRRESGRGLHLGLSADLFPACRAAGAARLFVERRPLDRGDFHRLSRGDPHHRAALVCHGRRGRFARYV